MDRRCDALVGIVLGVTGCRNLNAVGLGRGARLLLFAAIAFGAAIVGGELGVLGAALAGALAALLAGVLIYLWRAVL